MLGYCKINIENIEKGVNNQISADIITKKDSKIVGCAEIQIYKWDEVVTMQNLDQNKVDICPQKILFEDPGC